MAPPSPLAFLGSKLSPQVVCCLLLPILLGILVVCEETTPISAATTTPQPPPPAPTTLLPTAALLNQNASQQRPYIEELLSINLPQPAASVSFNNVTYELDDSNKAVIDYGDDFMDALHFVATEKAAGADAARRLESLVAAHHNNEQLHQYLSELAQQYPDVTRLYSIGESVEGRKLWVLELSENPGRHELLKPEFKYVANMHGNEVVGRELLLHLARLILENYRAAQEEPKDDRRPTGAKFAKKLLQTTRIHLMPSMNPDGRARSKPSCMYEKLSQLGRLNAKNIDLNRNFPDHNLGNQVDGFTQPEVLAVMKWSKSTPFVLSANLHGGSLVVSYPYEASRNLSAGSGYNASPDDDVFRHLALVYSKSHKNMWQGKKCYDECTDYHPEVFPQGITNGAAWYPLYGGMQDWMYENTNDFEVTVELGCNQFPEAATLPQYWSYNKRSLLNLIKEVHRGLKGTVADAVTGALLPEVNVHVLGRAHNISSTSYGDFFRILLPGFYELLFEKPGYESQKIFVTVQQTMAKIVNIRLQPINGQASNQTASSATVTPDAVHNLPVGEPSTAGDASTKPRHESAELPLLWAVLVMTIVIVVTLFAMAGAYVVQRRRLARCRSLSMELQAPGSRSTGISLPPVCATGAGSSQHLSA